MKVRSATFGQRLAIIRRARRLTQADLGASIGVPRQRVAAWENSGTGWIEMGDVRRCARAVRCRVTDLLASVDAPYPAVDPRLWCRTKRRLRAIANQTRASAL